MNDPRLQPAARPPAAYLPFLTGRYEVKPGLRKFGADFGNGAADQRVFQFDRDFPAFRAAKLEARAHLDRCYITADYAPDVAAAVADFNVQRLIADEPALFERRGAQLHCRLTGQTIDPTLDALAMQVPEDLAVTVLDGGRNYVAALQVCLPSHWDPRKKIGGAFAEVHTVVPGMAPVNERQSHFVRQMIEATDGLVRFVWGVQWGDALNRHPDIVEPPSDHLFVRVERQTIWGLPAVNASLFTIRPYLMDGREFRGRPEWREPLVEALRTMSEESAKYKGLAGDRRARVIDWLRSDPGQPRGGEG